VRDPANDIDLSLKYYLGVPQITQLKCI